VRGTTEWAPSRSAPCCSCRTLLCSQSVCRGPSSSSTRYEAPVERPAAPLRAMHSWKRVGWSDALTADTTNHVTGGHTSRRERERAAARKGYLPMANCPLSMRETASLNLEKSSEFSVMAKLASKGWICSRRISRWRSRNSCPCSLPLVRVMARAAEPREATQTETAYAYARSENR
jgi:hypothetical protein